MIRKMGVYMKEISIEQIAAVVGGRIVSGDPQKKIDNVQYDSRAVGAGSLFVPIVGENVDAHRFIPQCLEKGAAVFTQNDLSDEFQGEIIRVDNTLDALQRLAGWYRRRFTSLHFIGVTGSVGKTSTKEMIAAALSGGMNVMKTPGNRNSQIGMPCTMFDIKDENEAAVIEMGMSMPGEMDRLCDVAYPNMAVMTNIGTAHIENLGSRENILKEKFRITKHFTADDVLFINGDDPLLLTLCTERGFGIVRFGMSAECDYRAENITTENFETKFTCISPAGEKEYTIPALGEHSVRNALAAIAVSERLGLGSEQIQRGLSSYKNAPMRQQIYHLDGFTLIDDSYNASPEATKVSLDVLRDISKGKTIAVLADMLELGEQAEAEHYGVGEHLAKNGISCLLTVGELSRSTARGAKENGCPLTESFETNDEAFDRLKQLIEPGCSILIKGSRGMHTDEIVKKTLEETNGTQA